MSLLIVDDGILHHTVVQKACEKLQLSFAGAETEKAALALYEAGRRFDIVLMDIHIGADTLGYDVARKILELDPTALIISFSSDSIEIRREKGGKIMVGHLRKTGLQATCVLSCTEFCSLSRECEGYLCSFKMLSIDLIFSRNFSDFYEDQIKILNLL